MRTKQYIAVMVFALLAVIAGCGVKPNTAQQAVYQVAAEYNVALQAAVDYKNLPPCSAGTTLVCSDATIVAKLQAANTTASAAIAQAEAAVTAPNATSSTVSTALAAAQAALAALTAIESSLKTK